jgi:membrane AbrB-like protein
MSSSRARPFAGLSLSGQWAVLIAISVVTTTILEWARLPAALMLGPMAAGILMATGGGTIRIPRLPMNLAQAVIGCLIARSFTLEIVVRFIKDWPLFLAIVATTVVASAALGWLISKLRIIQGTTAVWGLLPGAAPVMILMAEAFGADAPLVAFMQYLRVVFVAIVASLIARFWVHIPADAAHAMVWFPPVAWLSFLGTLLIMAVSFLAVFVPRIPAGVLIAAMAVGGALHIGGYSAIELPPWFLAIGFAFIGWNTGMRFTPKLLAAVARALPQSMLSVAAMIAFCGALAALLVRVVGVDPLTAYLATSPGGVDSVAIIAASTKVDTSFVMAMQSVRFLLILLVGPALSKFVAGLVGGDAGRTPRPSPASVQQAERRAAENDLGDLD